MKITKLIKASHIVAAQRNLNYIPTEENTSSTIWKDVKKLERKKGDFLEELYQHSIKILQDRIHKGEI